jgi:hypothetical protein
VSEEQYVHPLRPVYLKSLNAGAPDALWDKVKELWAMLERFNMDHAIEGTRALLNQLDIARSENSRLCSLLLAQEAKIRALQAKLQLANHRVRFFEERDS